MSDVPAKSTPDLSDDVGEKQSTIPAEKLEQIQSKCEEVTREVGRIFIGSPTVVESLLVALFAGGHILLEGVPGVAKTTLCRAFARTIDAEFRRIQFTPDLLPSDITGTYVPDLRNNEFNLRKGPVFANVLLGDEINRAPAKTQSALLEAMQEHQVTIEGRTHQLPAPFIVLATQNPVEQQGVYPLPEAQLDRFLLKLTIDYPTVEQELDVLKTHRHQQPPPKHVWDREELEKLIAVVEEVHVSDEMMRYILSLVRQTRRDDRVVLGASPRATLALLKGAQARALIRGRDYVLPDDVRELARSILAHRVMLHPDAELDGVRGGDVVDRALQRVRYG